MSRLLKRNWVLTDDSFNRLLEALDRNRERAAEQYEHLRRSLIRYFDWHGSIHSERDADVTIDRVARKLYEGSEVVELYSFALGIARNVNLESLRLQQREQASNELSLTELVNEASECEDSDRRQSCFEGCLEQLPPAKRELILAYYEGDRRIKISNRQKLADAAGMPINRLRIQVHRIREKLENCIEQCLSNDAGVVH